MTHYFNSLYDFLKLYEFPVLHMLILFSSSVQTAQTRYILKVDPSAATLFIKVFLK